MQLKLVKDRHYLTAISLDLRRLITLSGFRC